MLVFEFLLISTSATPSSLADLAATGRCERQGDRQLLGVRRGQVHKGLLPAADVALRERQQFELNKHQPGASGDLPGAQLDHQQSRPFDRQQPNQYKVIIHQQTKQSEQY